MMQRYIKKNSEQNIGVCFYHKRKRKTFFIISLILRYRVNIKY